MAFEEVCVLLLKGRGYNSVEDLLGMQNVLGSVSSISR